ncbi:MAG: hypothetical protein IJF52_02605 [Clostridia bacterium]|nr:hypothetical protein [Clostridia bacterium]
MKTDKLKIISLRVGLIFFIILIFLTYFSSTIDNMLLPKVKTTEVIRGTLVKEENPNPNDNKFLIPISAVSGFGGSVFVLNRVNDDYIVNEVNISILASDEMYYEVSSFELYGGNKIVYKTSKSISDGDRVYLEEG